MLSPRRDEQWATSLPTFGHSATVHVHGRTDGKSNAYILAVKLNDRGDVARPVASYTFPGYAVNGHAVDVHEDPSSGRRYLYLVTID